MIDLLRKMWSSLEGFLAVHSILCFLKLSSKLLIGCGQFWFCHENMTSFSDLTSFRSMGGRFINLNTCNEKYNFYFVGEAASILPVSKLPSKEWLQKECDFKNPLLFKILRIFLEICSKDNVRVEFGLFFKKILISKDYF